MDIVAKNTEDAKELAEMQVPEEWTIEEWDDIDVQKPMDLGAATEKDRETCLVAAEEII